MSAPPAGLLSLAVVELQLVMQFLQAADILRFARCSRFMRRTADSAHAWAAWAKQTPVTVLVTTESLQSSFASQAHRYAAVRLVWSEECRHPRLNASVAQLMQVASRFPLGHVRGLDAFRVHSLSGFTALLQSPVFQCLQSIVLPAPNHSEDAAATPEIVELLSKLPGLSSVHLSDLRSDSLGSLCRFPALTDLSVVPWTGSLPPILEPIVLCPKLLRLSFRANIVDSARTLCASLQSSPSFAELRFLRFVGWHTWFDDDGVAVVRVLAGMPSLETLAFAYAQRLDVTIEALSTQPLPPRLKRLSVEPLLTDEPVAIGSPGLIAALLRRAPVLSCTLVLRRCVGSAWSKSSQFVAATHVAHTFRSDPWLQPWAAEGRFTIDSEFQ